MTGGEARVEPLALDHRAVDAEPDVAAAAHRHFGAVWGEGDGLHGQSYAIDTMSGLEAMAANVARFLDFARTHPELTFLVTPIGCGIAGYAPSVVAPMFDGASENVILPTVFAAG